jgi:NADPH:quinone reductase-like Zn-dependent oxidoreductase
MTNYLARPNADDLNVLKDLIEAGKLKPLIGATYSLSDVPDAMRELGTGHGRGKVVITL